MKKLKSGDHPLRPQVSFHRGKQYLRLFKTFAYYCRRGGFGFLPFLTVLANTHSPTVSRCWVAAGALTHLEADATTGAARGPGSPGSPRSISMLIHKVTSVSFAIRQTDKSKISFSHLFGLGTVLLT